MSRDLATRNLKPEKHVSNPMGFYRIFRLAWQMEDDIAEMVSHTSVNGIIFECS